MVEEGLIKFGSDNQGSLTSIIMHEWEEDWKWSWIPCLYHFYRIKCGRGRGTKCMV